MDSVPQGSTTVRVGADLMRVRDVADSVTRFGGRYTSRVYTPHELASCGGAVEPAAEGLAARFAAKEAMVKVLRPQEHQPDWRSIEVFQHGPGWCSLQLTGTAATLAAEAGIRSLAVSLSHEAGMACAVVVALCDEEGAGES